MSPKSNSLPLRSLLISASVLLALGTTACADSEQTADEASASALSGDLDLDENGNATVASLVARDGYLEIIRTGGVSYPPERDYCTLVPCSADGEFMFVARDHQGKLVSGFHEGDWINILISPAASKLLSHGYSLTGGVELAYAAKGKQRVALDYRSVSFRGGYYVGASFTIPSGVDALHPMLKAAQGGRPWMRAGSNDPGEPRASRAQGGLPIPIAAKRVKTVDKTPTAQDAQDM